MSALKRFWLWVRIKACLINIRSLEIAREGQVEALTYVTDEGTRANIKKAMRVADDDLVREYANYQRLMKERGSV